jgi:uncharacterized protein (TIGR00369 family)
MSALPENVRQLLETAIVRSPYGKLLDLSIVSAEPDRVRVKLPYRADVTTLGDTVHGGAIAGLVDAAATASFWAHPSASPQARGTTLGFSINFVAAGRGQDLVADAHVRRRGREICTGEVSVTDGAGREVAVALVTYKLSLTA